jgi:hypothetical protein
MRKGLLIAAALLLGASPLAAEQTTADPSSTARLGALRAAQAPNPYSKLFETRQALQQALQDKTAALTPAPKRRVVCGMTVIEVGPDVDPKMGVTPPKDEKTRFTIRAVDPPVCNPAK